MSKAISVSTGPIFHDLFTKWKVKHKPSAIFAIFTPYESILGVDDRSEIFFHYLKGRCWTDFHNFFTQSRAISGAINAWIHMTIVHFVSEHESEEWRRSILTLAKIAQN